MREASMSEDSEQSAHEDKAESFSLSGWWSVVDMCDWFSHAKKSEAMWAVLRFKFYKRDERFE